MPHGINIDARLQEVPMISAVQIVEALGGRSVLKERLRDYRAVIDRARSGLPYIALEAVAGRYAIPRDTLARVLHLPARTLARRKKERRLSAEESDRALGGVVPIDLLDSDLGALEVETILGRIEHGLYS